ncbi:molybdopterin-dependent oxidoreductase [Salipiger marinus]|uniref:molybdopterin-dependent oxidoreductase n=1 Tax=Salipiger marinus TaxID=555512 RepID=UPI004059963B
MSLLARPFLTVFTTLVLLVAPPVAAQEALPMPEGEPLLTVTGEISVTNQDEAAVFDRAMLESMETVTFTTSTIWTEGPQTFTGVPLSELMEAVGATGSSMKATAINDYAVDIPREDWVQDGPILAYLNDGEEMPVRDKGPLWVVYPYDLNASFQSEVIYSRSIWQLDRIVVVE